jgi:hypothetical protein
MFIQWRYLLDGQQLMQPHSFEASSSAALSRRRIEEGLIN